MRRGFDPWVGNIPWGRAWQPTPAFLPRKSRGQRSQVGYTPIHYSSVLWPSRVRLFATPWTAAHQASLSITSSRSLLKLMSIESVMPSNQLILCRPLLLLPSVFPSIRVFSNESVLHIRWPEYWSFSFGISPSSEHSGYSPHGCKESEMTEAA